MSAANFTAEDVANFLTENPDFFQDHADLFSSLRIPHPNESRAISLGERQILTLRSKAKELEWKLSNLIHNASGNEKISKALMAWCSRMLAEPNPINLPGHIVRSLGDMFDLPTVALRLWDLPALGSDSEFTQDVTSNIRQYAQELTHPYCGPLQDQEAASWLGTAPASLAIIPLKPHNRTQPFGLLVLGADDPKRFSPNMGTTFLDTINELASASLTRLDSLNDEPERA